MSGYIYINDVEFIDETGGAQGPYVYSLTDEQTASTVGVYSSEEKAAEAIERLVKKPQRSNREFWGVVYALDRDIV